MLARLEQELRDQAKADTEADAMVAEHSQRANVESGAVLAREPEVAPLNITSPTGKVQAELFDFAPCLLACIQACLESPAVMLGLTTQPRYSGVAEMSHMPPSGSDVPCVCSHAAGMQACSAAHAASPPGKHQPFALTPCMLYEQAVLTAINQKRKMFPPYATQTKDQLNWQASMAPIKQPAASAASQSSKPVTSRKQEAHAGDAPVNTTARAEALRQPADRKQRQHRPAESAAEAHARPPAVDRAPDKDASLQGGQPMPASSDEQLDVVDFMTADDGTASAPAPAPAPAHAYDSSDADEPVGQPSKRSRSEAPQEQGLAHVANGRSQKQPSHRSEQLDVRRRGSVLSNLAMIRLTDEQEAAVLAEFAHAAMEDLDGNSDSSVSDEDEAGWELEEAESEELGKLQHLHACQCIDCAA